MNTYIDRTDKDLFLNIQQAGSKHQNTFSMHIVSRNEALLQGYPQFMAKEVYHLRQQFPVNILYCVFA